MYRNLCIMLEADICPGPTLKWYRYESSMDPKLEQRTPGYLMAHRQSAQSIHLMLSMAAVPKPD